MTDLVRYQDRPTSMEIAGQAWKIAEKIAGTEMVPTALRGRPEAVLAIMLAGHEAGVEPMQSLQSIHIIEGRPAMSAQLMRALVMRHGHELIYDDVNTTAVTASGRRKGSERWTKVTWTMDDAKRGGLDQKTNWKKWPRAMLIARATAELCRMIFPDVLAGIPYTVEELTDGDLVDGGVVDFGPPEIATLGVPVKPAKTARAAKAITKAVVPDAPDTLPPPPRGEVPVLPGDDAPPPPPPPPVDASPVAAGSNEPIDTTATETVDEDWPSGEWPSDPDVAENRARLSGAQVVAIKLRELFSIREKEERRAAVSFLVGREVASSKDLTADEIRVMLDRLNDWPTDTPLHPEATDTEPVAETTPETPAPAAETDAQEPTTDAVRSPRQRDTPTSIGGPPEAWTGDQWRNILTQRKVKVTAVLPYAQRLAAELDPPKSIALLDDIAGAGIAEALLGWIEDQSVGKSPK